MILAAGGDLTCRAMEHTKQRKCCLKVLFLANNVERYLNSQLVNLIKQSSFCHLKQATV